MKFKEGFSRQLIQDFLGQVKATELLDPFSGMGTAPITACSVGASATGIEIMPVGNLVAEGVVSAARLETDDVKRAGSKLLHSLCRGECDESFRFPHLPITERAFPFHTESDLAKARKHLSAIADPSLRTLLTLACISVLEEVSYTRKDGQFLRWDIQSGRDVKPKLHKPFIPTLHQALTSRLNEIVEDIPALRAAYSGVPPRFIQGSCLDELRVLPSGSFDCVATSPPYANRYDYTRTYALELAFLGYDAEGIKELRQELLSATVENRSKRDHLIDAYQEEAPRATDAFHMADNQAALQEALSNLRVDKPYLSNPNVISLLENYFTEMALVVSELGRLVREGGNVFMVNDNVRYHGQEIPVDLILSDFAEQSGFDCVAIWTLSRGKGNSSQQMRRFGRQELRKCVYHWRKSHA